MINDQRRNRSETARARMVVDIPTGRPEDSLAMARDRLFSRGYAAVDTIYVTDERGRLIGLVPLAELLRHGPHKTLGQIMVPNPPAVHPGADQEAAVALAVDRGLGAAPVVDDIGRLVGAVPQHTLLRILRQEHLEDLDRLAGMSHRSEQDLAALRGPPVRRLGDRLPWLVVGMLGSGVAAWVMSRFADVLESWVVVAFFVPGIVYLADAIGTQTETITVRAFSAGQRKDLQMLAGEVATGLLLGVALAALAFPLIWLAFGEPRLAGAVSLSVVASGAIATGIGLLLPWGLAAAGRDPAFGSGPLATVLQDILSVLIYFVLVRALLM